METYLRQYSFVLFFYKHFLLNFAIKSAKHCIALPAIIFANLKCTRSPWSIVRFGLPLRDSFSILFATQYYSAI